MSKHQLFIACTQKLDGVPEVIQLLPMGKVTSTKGNFIVDRESYRLMCKAMSDHGVDLVIDYEHQTLSGNKAPAAGWIKELILTNHGIDARVEWTEEAAGYLKNNQYRYTSPVLLARSTDKKAIRLLSLALTNTPAIDGMFPIINSEFYEGDDDEMEELIKKLAQLLGLPETATGEEVMATVTTLKEQCKQKDELVVNSMLAPLLGVDAKADLPTVSAKIMALTAHTGFVPKSDYDTVKTKLDKLESGGMVELALKDGKITPAQKAWAQQYVLTDKDGFAKFLECATAVVPMGSNTIPPAVDAKALDPNTLLVCKSLGISEEDVKQYGGN